MRFLTIGLMAFLFAQSCFSADVKTLEIGAKAPNFDLPGVDDQNHRLSDFKDAEILVVLFTCNHCPTAQAYEDRIIQLHADYSDKNVALVAISPNSAEAVRLDELGYSDLGDSLDDMKIRAKDKGFKFPYLYDGKNQFVSKAFGVRATPHAYVFDKARRLRYVGRIDDNEIGPPKSHDLKNALDALLAGEEVPNPKTRVFGCSTKWLDKIESAKAAVEQWNNEEAELKLIKPSSLREKLTEKSENYRLVNVWATWCIPCVKEMDDLVQIHRMYRGRHFELITVSADDKGRLKQAKKVLNDKHCSATNYLVDAESHDDLFDAVDPEWEGAVPYTAFISPEGKVIHRIHGEFDPQALRRKIVDHIGRTYADKK